MSIERIHSLYRVSLLGMDNVESRIDRLLIHSTALFAVSTIGRWQAVRHVMQGVVDV